MQEIHDNAVEEYMDDVDGFDFKSFEMHLSCEADNFIDFWHEHYQHLNNNIYC